MVSGEKIRGLLGKLKLEETNGENEKQKEMQNAKFNLLLLPLLALQNCLRFLELLQFIDFSLLSKRTKFISSTIHREKIGINLQFERSSLIYLTTSRNPVKGILLDLESIMAEFPDKVFKTIEVEQERSSEEDEIENIKWIAEHLRVVLRSPIKCINIDDYVEPYMGILKWLRDLQPNLDCIDIDGKSISSESLSFILEEFHVKEKLALDLKPSDDDFRYNQPINVHSLFVSDSSWITMDSILASENAMISISETCFTSSNLNFLIKKWIEGWNKRLEMLEITMKVEDYKPGAIEESFEIITEGIEYEPSPENSGRPKFITLDNGYRVDLDQGEYFEMKRNDGKRAAFLHRFMRDTDRQIHQKLLFLAW